MADAAGGNDADDPSVTRREGVPGSHLHSGDRDRARLRDVVNALATEKNLERFVREPNSNHPFFSLEDVDEVDNIKWRHLYGKEEGKIDLVLLTRELPKYLLGLLIGRELQEGEAAVFPVKSGVDYAADLMHGFMLLNELIQCQAQVCKIRNRPMKGDGTIRPSSAPYRNDVLDSALLSLLYITEELGDSRKEDQDREFLCLIVLEVVSLLANFFGLDTNNLAVLYPHITELLAYKQLDCLFQRTFHGMAFVLRELEWVWKGQSRHTDPSLEQITGSLSFFTKYFLCGAFYSRFVHNPSSLRSLLDFLLVALEEVMLKADDFAGLSSKIYGSRPTLYLLVRVLDLLQVLVEFESVDDDRTFQDVAMETHETASVMRLVVKRIQDLYCLACCAIATRGASQSDEVPLSLINLYEVSLFRVVEHLAGDTNFQEELCLGGLKATYSLFEAENFSAQWMRKPIRGVGGTSEFQPSLMGGSKVGTFSMEGQENYDTLIAIYEVEEERGPHMVGDLKNLMEEVDVWVLEKSLYLYKILLDTQMAGKHNLNLLSKKALMSVRDLLEFIVSNVPRTLMSSSEGSLLQGLRLALGACGGPPCIAV